MTVSPDDISNLARRIGIMAEEMELEILRVIGRRLRRGEQAPDWALRKQAELLTLNRELEILVAARTRAIRRETAKVVNESYVLGANAAKGDLIQAGFTDVVAAIPAARLAALAIIARDVSAQVAGLAPRALRAANDVYAQAVAQGALMVASGTATRQRATQMVLNKFADAGLSVFMDSRGRRWTLPTYAEMAVRTGAGRVAVDGHLDTLQAAGQNLVHIIPGPRPCPVCDGWAGRILSISGSLAVVVRPTGHARPTATMEQARAAGWGHPNCRCSTGLYVPGFSKTTTERPGTDTYEDGQEQRRIERGIRKWKSREAVAQDQVAAREARAKVREWQAQMRAHLADHPDLRRLPHRERLLSGSPGVER